VVFFTLDTSNFGRAPKPVRERETAHEQWRFQGLGNLILLAAVLGAVLINHPPFLREAIMIGAAAGSYLLTRREVHDANHFDFGPLKEVAILFAGIFATMMPALDWLGAHATGLGQPGSALFFWGSGALSSVLDNAPTYLSFLSTAFGVFVPADTAAAIAAYFQVHGADLSSAAGPNAEQICHALPALQLYFPAQLAAGRVTLEQAQMAVLLSHPVYLKCLQAISIGSVFFGANTYIGNGPNFMIKAIADQQKAHTPGFMGYIFKFTLPVMLPMLVIVWWVFFRN
jgi:Na+/H+ antiporter NhaD/arsenite permease-like protein